MQKHKEKWAWIYLKGKGVAKNPDEATKWLVKSAEKEGYSGEWPTLLGDVYFTGEGVSKDIKKSLKWHRVGASNNQPRSYLILGIANYHGLEMSRNLVMAYAWFNMASLGGSTFAQDAKKYIHIITKEMSAEQIGLAQRTTHSKLIGTLGWEFYVTGEHSLALSTSQRALKFDKRLAFVHANIGLLYTLKRDLDKAIASYRQCLELDKNELENVAIQDLINLQKRSKETIEVHYALGFCYEAVGNVKSARLHYSKYLETEDEGKYSKLAKDKLSTLRAN